MELRDYLSLLLKRLKNEIIHHSFKDFIQHSMRCLGFIGDEWMNECMHATLMNKRLITKWMNKQKNYSDSQIAYILMM